MLGGVCCGIAERFDFDVALLRILVVVLTVLSAGAFALVYLAVWLVLPAKQSPQNTVDVDPAAFRSEVYEQVVCSTATPTESVYTPIPPVPPAAASAYYQSAPHATYAGSAKQTAPSPQAVKNATQAAAKPKASSTGLVAGILIMCVAFIALTSALGFFTVDVNAWATQAGPFLLIGLGLFIMGRASHSDVLIVCAGFALVMFLIVGAYFSLQEGPTELGVSLPFSPDSIIQER